MSAAKRWGTVVIAALALLGLDQLTKWWAVDRLKGQLPIDVVWTLRFNYAENTGMAFSKGTGAGRWISLVVLVIVVALVVLARSVRSVGGLVLIGVVIGGAFGNLADRVLRAEAGFLTGGVVDWIDFQWWPIFNVADAAVVLGGVLIALFLLREPVDDRALPADAPVPPVPPMPDAAGDGDGGGDGSRDAGSGDAESSDVGSGVASVPNDASGSGDALVADAPVADGQEDR